MLLFDIPFHLNLISISLLFCSYKPLVSTLRKILAAQIFHYIKFACSILSIPERLIFSLVLCNAVSASIIVSLFFLLSLSIILLFSLYLIGVASVGWVSSYEYLWGR